MSGVLFIPEWTTADYWTEIFDKAGNLKFPFKTVGVSRPFIIQDNFVKNSPFKGRTNFNFLEIYF